MTAHRSDRIEDEASAFTPSWWRGHRGQGAVTAGSTIAMTHRQGELTVSRARQVTVKG
jgi:hypothetical protein